MVTFNPGRHSQIKSCGTLCIDPVSIMLSTKSVKNAWIYDCNFEKEWKPCDLCSVIPWGFWLVNDCKRFLEGSGVCLDQRESLNCVGRWFSVCDFSLEKWNLLWPFLSVLGREWYCQGLHMCFVMSINQNNGHWSLAIMFLISSITNIETTCLLCQNLNFLLGIGLARIWNVLHGASKQFNTKYIPPLISLIFIWILKI